MFWKGHGLGNDYLVVDRADLPWPLTVPRTRRICDRHRGLGSDGILIGDLSRSPIGLDILNPDGSIAEKSGNGLRIFAAWLFARGRVHVGEPFEVALVKDTVRMCIENVLDHGELDVRVEIGRASFHGRDAGFAPVAGEALGYPLDLPDGGRAEITPLSLSNPHCVVFVDTLDRADFVGRAPLLCTHAAFPAGVNVQFARMAGPRTIDLWIWERGAGETQASGSSACAVAAVAVRRGLAQPGRFAMRMPGGSAEVTVSPGFDIELRAPAEIIYQARFTPNLMERLAAEA